MAPCITAWGDSDHLISPVGSGTPSIVSVDSILSEAPKKSLGVNEIPRASGTQIKCMSSQTIESLGNRLSVGNVKHSGFDYSDDNSSIRHPKYFFTDGKITFFVRDVHDGYIE